MRSSAEWISSKLPVCVAQDILEMPLRYSGAKRQRYLDAVDRYLRFGIQVSDSYCTMFCKSERFDGSEKCNPDPRAIQFRGARFCVALAQFLQPIEHHVYTISGVSAGVPETRNIAKGLNSVQRAEVLSEKLSHFIKPVVLSLDASRFDKHIDVAHLKIEHSVYLSSNPHFLFRRLLSLQLINKVYASSGLKYVAQGRRMSGDMNTALGNCLLMLIMLHAYCSNLTLDKWDCFDDGDDCLLIVEEEVLDSIKASVVSWFLEFGMEMKVERVARSLFEVVFCKSSVVEYTEARFKFVRDYRAVISKSLCGIRHWQDPNYRIKVLRAIGICELILNLGVPVLQSFALCLLRNVGRTSDIHLASDGLRARVSRELRGLGVTIEQVKPRLITEVARESFAVAFNCAVDEQLHYEAFFDRWVFRVEGAAFWGAEWEVARWLPHLSSQEVYPLWQNAETEIKQAKVGPICQIGHTSRFD